MRAALHLKSSSGSRFGYDTSGPASITLWPFLAKHLRVVIYNGDADACVPYVGNEEVRSTFRTRFARCDARVRAHPRAAVAQKR